MSDRELDSGLLEEPALRARVPILRRRPLLPAPEVVLLLDRDGRIVRSSARFPGERLSRFEFAEGLDVHDIFHGDCETADCELGKTWQAAWNSHRSGLPVEWLWLLPQSDLSLKLRLQPVSYACGALFPDALCGYDDHSVLFMQDLGATRNDGRSILPDENVRLENATLYMQRRSGDRDPDLVASLDRRLRLVTGRMLIAQDAERRRIGSELHDSLGQTLSLLRLEVEGLIERATTGDIGNCRESLDRLYRHVRNSTDELRGITNDLHARSLAGGGLLDALEAMCADFRAVIPQVKLTFEVVADEYEIPTDIGIAIYRIAQEGLNNIARHSEASNASLELAALADGIRVSVEDDGAGFEPDRVRAGLGMITMRERAKRLSGEFSLDTGADAGCRITAYWPIDIVRSMGDETVFNSVGRNG